jgi:hypothetical protein
VGALIYLFDMSRGVEILRLAGGRLREPADGGRARSAGDPLAARAVSGLTPGSLVCPVFVTPSQG